MNPKRAAAAPAFALALALAPSAFAPQAMAETTASITAATTADPCSPASEGAVLPEGCKTDLSVKRGAGILPATGSGHDEDDDEAEDDDDDEGDDD